MQADTRNLVVHILHRFDTGGLENGVVNLINHMPSEAYRHAVVALTEVTDFRNRLRPSDVECISLHKAPGHGAMLYPRLIRLLRRLAPSVVHTRNLGPLEMQVAAAISRVPVRIHGEHGREVDDLDGTNRKYRLLRRAYSPFVHRYVALSQDLNQYLNRGVGIDAARIAQIYNGVDTNLFHPRFAAATQRGPVPFRGEDEFVVGTVGRMQSVKNQALLAHAFVRARSLDSSAARRLRLALIGDGPLLAECAAIVNAADAQDSVWMPSVRDDVAEVMRGLDVFVLPSLAEGISNTILEAMASGLPVIATDVGGNRELVQTKDTGLLVPSRDVDALAAAILELAREPERAQAMGRKARAVVEARFSIGAMVGAYRALYDQMLAGAVQRQGGR